MPKIANNGTPFLVSDDGAKFVGLKNQDNTETMVQTWPEVVAYGDTGVSGTNNVKSSTIAVAPTAASTRQVFGGREQVDFNSAFSVTGSGYTSVKQFNLTLAGVATHVKAVGILTQVSAVGGNVTAMVGVESEPLAIGAATTVGSYAAFYCANVAGVANIGNVQLFYPFANDHIGAPAAPLAQPSIIKHAGIYVNGGLNELAPAYHPGLVAGRYYSAPTTTLAPLAVSANVAYMMPIYIPHRCNPTKLGVNVTLGAAGNVVLGLYRSSQSAFPGGVNGVPTTLVAQTAPLSTLSIAAVEGTITIPAGYIDAGLYFITALFQATPSVTQHAPDASRLAIFGAAAPTDANVIGFVATAYSATLPATVGVMSYSTGTSEPRLWLRL